MFYYDQVLRKKISMFTPNEFSLLHASYNNSHKKSFLMIEGSDLYAAYQPMSSSLTMNQEVISVQPTRQAAPKAINPPPAQETPPKEDLQRQIEHKQRVLQAVKELQQQQQQTVQSSSVQVVQDTYIDKLLSKRREILRLLQIALIIVLALSIHHAIKHGFKRLVQVQDWSADKELTVRLLYPLGVLLLLWNFKVWTASPQKSNNALF